MRFNSAALTISAKSSLNVRWKALSKNVKLVTSAAFFLGVGETMAWSSSCPFDDDFLDSPIFAVVEDCKSSSVWVLDLDLVGSTGSPS
mmetsp:Transcript_4732/g.7054  ORF Transcript_4732/g.7054 Transcript_4732/m.7054 type:complete len:88 (-) Transcript_4732:750-1013(-)